MFDTGAGDAEVKEVEVPEGAPIEAIAATADPTTGDIANLQLHFEGDIVKSFYDKACRDEFFEGQQIDVMPNHHIIGVYGRAKPGSHIEQLGFCTAKFV